MGLIDGSNPKSIKVEVEVRTEITIKANIRTDTDQVTGHEQNYRRSSFRGNMRSYSRKTVEENTETAIEMTVMTEAGTGLERGCFPEIMAIIELEI